MKRMVLVTVTAVVALAAPAFLFAQAKADFSGSWVYQQAQSKADPAVNFPTELVLKQTASDLTFTGTSNHQEPYSGVYKFDGTPTSFTGPAGKATAKASWQGDTLVAITTRSYTGPQGEVTVQMQETYSLNAGALTVQRVQTVGDLKRSDMIVYAKGTR